MMHRVRCVAHIPRAMLFTSLLAGCGSYDNGSKGAAGASGSMAAAGSLATFGGAPTGGSGGATGGVSNPPKGGAPNTAGEAGSGGGGAPVGGASGGTSGGGGAASGGEKAACVEAAPCGGDVVGTWTAASCEIKISGMADMGPTGLGCPTAPVTGSIAVSGTWTAAADGKFVDATTTKGTAVIELAKVCLAISGFATTCDRIPLDPLGLNSVVCVDNAATQGCTCTATINQSGGMAAISIDASFNGPEGWSGKYTAADNKVVATAEGIATPTEYSYCVAGNTMTMNLTTVSLVGTLTGPIVLQKQ